MEESEGKLWLAIRVLRWFCPTHLLEEIEGDLLQRYEGDVKKLGERNAKRRLLWNVIRFCRPGILIRNKMKTGLGNMMILEYLRSGIRQFRKAPGFSFLHTIGTMTGLIAILLIYLFLRFELSYDTTHPDSGNLYRINLQTSRDGKVISESARTSPPFGAIAASLLQSEIMSRAAMLGVVIMGHQNNFIREQQVLVVDSNHLQLFNYKILSGNKELALRKPLTVMLSERIAKKLFHAEDPIGKIISINSENFDGTVDFEVTGVFANQPGNMHLHPEVLISYATLYHFIGPQVDERWNWQNLFTYTRIQPGTDIKQIQGKMDELLMTKHGEDLKTSQEKWTIELQKVNTIHTTTTLNGEFEPGMKMFNLILAGVIAGFVLFTLLTNSVNLTLSRSLKRAKEVAVRKVSGASGLQLIAQFISEAFVIHIISLALALMAVLLLYPMIAGSLNLPLYSYYQLLKLLFVPGFIYLLISALSCGLYPALVLSRYLPSQTLRGFTHTGNALFGFRKSLLTLQFIISILMIAGTFTGWQQLHFMNDHDLGLNIANKLVIRAAQVQEKGSNSRALTFKEELLKIPGVRKAASLNEIPGNEVYWRSDQFHREGMVSASAFSWLTIDHGYFDLFEIPVIAGRNFNTQSDNYQSSVIINEAAATTLGFTINEDAISSPLFLNDQKLTIVGITRNFHQEGLAKKIEPLIFRYSPGALNYFVIDISEASTPNKLYQVENLFHTIFPNSPFEYFMLDDHFNEQYQTEQKLTSTGASLAIFLLILNAIGLAGLSMEAIASRSKELSIRKILGATTRRLLYLMSKEYLVMLLIASVISLPFLFFGLKEWLNRFAFRIDLTIWTFLIPMATISFILVIGIGWQAVAAIRANPVKSLRSE